MKYLSLLFGILILTSCGPSLKEKEAALEKAKIDSCKAAQEAIKQSYFLNLVSNFDAPYSKRNQDLSEILGDSFQVYSTCEGIRYILTFRIQYTKKNTLIINSETSDTVFRGTVCRNRDFYYLTEKIMDKKYRIFAWKITDTFIYGLYNYYQYYQIDTAITNGSYPKLIKFVEQNKNNIVLQSKKRKLRQLFTSIINSTKPFEFVKPYSISKTPNKEDLANTIEPDNEVKSDSTEPNFEVLSNSIKAEGLNIIAKVYPIPTKDIIHIDLQQYIGKTDYFLSDMKGKILMQGQFNDINNKIDVSRLANGTYALTILKPNHQKETIKIFKIK
jgi:hypothetical protein